MEMRLPAPCVVVLIGPSSSGKSTWAKENFEQVEIASSDELRSRVGTGEDDLRASNVAFDLLETIVGERIDRQLTTVIDTLGLDAAKRKNWIARAHSSEMPIYAVTFSTPLDICLERNSARSRPLARSVITNQSKRHEEVLAEIVGEGFDSILEERPVRVVPPQLVSRPQSESVGSSPAHTFGLMVSRFAWGDQQLGPTLAGIARRAEVAGFRDLWVMDHFRQIPSVGRPWEDIPEAYTTLSFLAGQTSKIRLGALVSAITHRNPAVLGKMIATLDVLSGGRANAGLGIAWDAAEHAGYGLEFPDVSERYQFLAESIELLRLLWGKGTPGYSGKHVTADNLSCYPRPLQDKIPIMIGGSGEKKTLRLVAQLADAANVFGPPQRVAHKVAVLRNHCAALGRDPAEIEVSHLVNAMASESKTALRERIENLRNPNTTAEEFARRNNAALADDLVSLFVEYNDAGASHSIISIPDPQVEGSVEAFAAVIRATA